MEKLVTLISNNDEKTTVFCIVVKVSYNSVASIILKYQLIWYSNRCVSETTVKCCHTATTTHLHFLINKACISTQYNMLV